MKYAMTTSSMVIGLGVALLVTGCNGGSEPKVTPTPTPDAKTPTPAAKTPTPAAKTPTAAAKAPTPDGLTPVPLPPWVGFPAASGTLQAAIDARDSAPLREHAWRLWAGLSQPISAEDPRPLWWTWSTTTQLFETPPPASLGSTAITQHRHAARAVAAAAVAQAPQPPVTPDPTVDHTDECFDPTTGAGVIFFPGPTYALPEDIVTAAGLDPKCAPSPDRTIGATYAAEHPSACTLADGPHFQNNGDILVATESYSEPGADRIETLRYNEYATLEALAKRGVTMLPELATEQVTTKHMVWPVKATGLSALPVFRELPKQQWCQYNGYETWTQLVAIDPSNSVTGQGSVEFMFGVYASAGTPVMPTTTATVDVHPMSAFYWQEIDPVAFDAMDPKDRMILDAASRWAHGKPFEPGDYVVAVASHIITKEIPQWTLQSAWWSDQPEQGPHAADRPALPDAVGPWDHYLMTIEYGITQEPSGDVLPVAFNPYIELAATHPVATNCRNCHLRAAKSPDGQYLTDTGPGPLASLSATDPVFEGLLLTDFQWVIADRVKPKP